MRRSGAARFRFALLAATVVLLAFWADRWMTAAGSSLDVERFVLVSPDKGHRASKSFQPPKPLNDFRKNLEDLINRCRGRSISPVLVVEYQGADHALGFDYRVTDLERIMVEVAAERGVPLLNANEHFYTQGDWRQLLLPEDIVHLNEQGHEKVAERIADYLIDRKLVP